VTRSTDTKDRIFSATLQLISEQGYTGTTVDEIVARAGVAKGTMYYHFSGKAELVEALIAEQLAPVAKGFRETAESVSDPTAAIDALVRFELEWIRDNRAFAKMLITELWREDRAWRQTLVFLRHQIIGSISEVISRGLKAHAFRGDIDPDFAGSALFGLVATTALDWLVFSPERPIEFIADQVSRLAATATRA